MLDAVDLVMKKHIQNLLFTNGKQISVFSSGTTEQDEQQFTQAGMDKQPDRVELPFVSLTRLSGIDITDENMTKRVHNYTGYKLMEGMESTLSYTRCTLHYVATVYAENRKLSEDLALALYTKLRNYCQITVAIRLPVEVEKGVYAAAEMDSDIVLGATIDQVGQLSQDNAQLYKCRIPFDLKNVNIYSVAESKKYKYNIFVQGQLVDEKSPKGSLEQIFPKEDIGG